MARCGPRRAPDGATVHCAWVSCSSPSWRGGFNVAARPGEHSHAEQLNARAGRDRGAGPEEGAAGAPRGDDLDRRDHRGGTVRWFLHLHRDSGAGNHHQLCDRRRSDPVGHADAGGDGDGSPGDRLLYRILAPIAGQLGRVHHGVALLVLLGHRGGDRNHRRLDSAAPVDPGASMDTGAVPTPDHDLRETSCPPGLMASSSSGSPP